MFLMNGSSDFQIYWRAFNPTDFVRAIGTQDGILSTFGRSGHTVEYNHPSGRFQLEVATRGGIVVQPAGPLFDNADELAVLPNLTLVSFKERKPAFFLPNTPMIVDGNGYLGLFSVTHVKGSLFTGLIYGNTLSGYWDPSNHIDFRRHLNSVETQDWRADELSDVAARGVFSNGINNVTLRPAQPQYPWRMARGLSVVGNGYVGTTHFETMSTDGSFTGSIYGDSISGRWNQATGQIGFLRMTADPTYTQYWVGRRTGELTFEGTFDERQRGSVSGSFAWKMGPTVALP